MHTDEDLSDDELVRAFDKSEFSKISDEEMQRELDDYELNVPRTVVGLKCASVHGHDVHEKFFYDASAQSHYKFKERMNYIHCVFGSLDGARWWIENESARGAPDDYCHTTGRLQEFYFVNDRQMVAFARTGYDASVGELSRRTLISSASTTTDRTDAVIYAARDSPPRARELCTPGSIARSSTFARARTARAPVRERRSTSPARGARSQASLRTLRTRTARASPRISPRTRARSHGEKGKGGPE